MAMESTFNNWSLDWAGTLGSDHTLTWVQGSLHHTPLPAPATPQDLSYVIDEQKAVEWGKCFKFHLAHTVLLPNRPTTDEVKVCTSLFHTAIQMATTATMKPRRPFHPKGSPWWNNDCTQAMEDLQTVESAEDRKCCTACLRAVAQKAKQSWGDHTIENLNLWEITTWCLGRRMNKIPPLWVEGNLAHEHADISCILSDRFFAAEPHLFP